MTELPGRTPADESSPTVVKSSTPGNGRRRLIPWRLKKRAAGIAKAEVESQPALLVGDGDGDTSSGPAKRGPRRRTRARRSAATAARDSSQDQDLVEDASSDPVPERVVLVEQVESETRIAVVEDKTLVEYYGGASTRSLIGNVYLAKVRKVMPSMEAAFVDIGEERDAILYAGDLDWSGEPTCGAARRIENALNPGDVLLVQVTKDPVAHKGARATALISFAGRYLVYCPQQDQGGISKKLSDRERSRVRRVLEEAEVNPQRVIVRTAAQHASANELQREARELSQHWMRMSEGSETGDAPSLIHQELPATTKLLRDRFTHDVHQLLLCGDNLGALQDYIESNAPLLKERVQAWEGPGDLFESWGIPEQVKQALERRVALPSGGHIVVDHTEAMTVVDVNTGKFTGTGGDLEDTVTTTNVEAAREVARQLRLRNIGGMVVVDFIDMDSSKNQDLVVKELKTAMSRDKTKHQISEVTSLGLVQITRKRVGTSLMDSHSRMCPTCDGAGTLLLTAEGVSGGQGAPASSTQRRSRQAGPEAVKTRTRTSSPETSEHKPKRARQAKSLPRSEPQPASADVSTAPQEPELPSGGAPSGERQGADSPTRAPSSSRRRRSRGRSRRAAAA